MGLRVHGGDCKGAMVTAVYLAQTLSSNDRSVLQPTEGRAKGEAHKLRGAPEGWKRCRLDRTAPDGITATVESTGPEGTHK